MTQKNVIDLARESGLHKMIQVKHVVDKVYEIPSEKLERFAALVRAEALEEAAKVCEYMGRTMPDRDGEITEWCAAAIRARSEK